MIVAHTHEKPMPISDRTQAPVPEPLERVIMQCLAKKPEDRPQTTMELSRMLAELNLESQWTAERAGQWWEEHEERNRD
jgi:serine/threonine-protein kinase